MSRVDDYDYSDLYDGAEEAFEEAIKDAFRRQSEDAIRVTLMSEGDVYTERAEAILTQARECLPLGFHGAALTLAASSVEIMIRFLVLGPLIGGAFLSDEWAGILSERITSGRSAEDREMLPAVLRQWKIDVTSLKLSNGKQFWETLVSVVWPRRNRFIHGGETVTSIEAELAIECSEVLKRDVLWPISDRLGLLFRRTGKWQ